MERFPCNPDIPCPLRDTIGCFEDVHHRYYPKREYRGQLERIFRDMEENKELTCRARHNEIHATQPTPEKPPRHIMLATIAQELIRRQESA